MYTLGFIGAGHLGSALLEGFLTGNVLPAASVCAYDPEESARTSLALKGVTVLDSEADVVSSSKIVVVAVRPSDVRIVMEKIRDVISFNNVLVSVAAGVTMSAIKKHLGKECKLVRAIPNVACEYGKGVTAMAYEMPITYQELQLVKDLFESLGILRVVEERRLNDYIAAASSSSAYFYYMVKSIAEAAVAQGIDPETASQVAASAMIGAAKTLETSKKSADELIASVATPKGTTVEAINIMEKSGFSQIMADAMLACTKRANDMDLINEP
ncbi:MAG: pyrroline-5-carboxylate reductase [Clostridia bacterium]|nr:pyrroline-5-carboxylate reductase [Clostridia bacterium]MBQ5820416.1 pyrroline-5-carboxylate reductase [Clostridia bacterium]